MGFAKFAIDLEPTVTGGGNTVMINDNDVTKFVKSLDVHAGFNEFTTVTLHVMGEGMIQGEGVVRVVEESSLDEVDVVLSFLETVDALALEHDVLESSDPSTPMGEAWLDALKRHAREYSDRS